MSNKKKTLQDYYNEAIEKSKINVDCSSCKQKKTCLVIGCFQEIRNLLCEAIMGGMVEEGKKVLKLNDNLILDKELVLLEDWQSN